MRFFAKIYLLSEKVGKEKVMKQLLKKSTVRRAEAFVLALVMVFVTVVSMASYVSSVQADDGVTLRVHYHRDDGDYDTWSSVWLWEDGADGAQYYFEEEDGEMVATMNVTAGCTSVGFIVRTEAWDKDIADDQFIDITEVVSGTVDVYIESGVTGYTIDYSSDAVTGIKVKAASYNGDGTVTVTMTASIDDYESAYSVSGTNGNIAIASVSDEGSGEYLITLEEELDYSSNYDVTYDGESYEISMPNIYSTAAFEEEYTYDGGDLGATWSEDSTFFRVWAPTAEAMYVNLYEGGTAGIDDLTDSIEMEADVNGTWIATVDGDLNGVYYTYTVVIGGTESTTVDPYARTTGVNGKRAMVIDLESTNPDGWDEDTNPHAGESITDAIIYEGHIRDLTVSEDSGITNTGKYLGLTETGTTTSGGVSTGLDYLTDLGITHLHLLPVYDFGSVDETQSDGYNWGYDPVNYNVPEGSYSTDPYNGEVRVSEFKEMVQALHNNGISVVMDVVYNHVYSASDFSINVLVPGYFSRIDENGTYSNGSGCGNDTASERSMVRKYIVDSVLYWVEEYHIDGFRFDLVGLLDTDTVNEIVETVHESYPDVIFYGEGWTLTTNVTKDDVTLATQTNSTLTPDFAYFNDTVRDSLKGSVFSETDLGYITGGLGFGSNIIKGFMASTSWCKSPTQTINYASCHDNLTLFAKILNATSSTAEFDDQVKMNNLAAAIYLTSEGVPFIMSGEEMLRTKETASGSYDSNSYSSGDSVNALQYSNLEDDTYQSVYQYYKGLIAFRKAHSALRLTSADDISENVSKISDLDDNVVGMDIKGGVNGETADEIIVIFNPNEESTTVELPEGEWNVYVNAESAGTEVLDTVEDSVTVDAISAMVLVQESAEETTSETTSNGSISPVTIVIIVVVVLIVIVGIVVAIVKGKG